MVNAPLHTEFTVQLRLRHADGNANASLNLIAKMSTSTDGKLTIVDDMDGKLVKCLREYHLFTVDEDEDMETTVSNTLAKIELDWGSSSLEPGNMIWLRPSGSELIIWDGVVVSMHITLQQLSLPAAMRT